ncbi:MAG: FG-GAP repeat domain-containing protein, partial [Planctomycetota bacterium]
MRPLPQSTKFLTACATALLSAPALAQFDVDPGVNYPIGTQPDGVAAIDIDGDTDLDLAATVDGPDRVAFLINDGTGAYAAGGSVLLPNSSSPGAIASGDFDGDLDDDLAIALQDLATVMILINSGGTFVDGGQFATQELPKSIDVADHDGDGDLDLAIANRDSNSVSILTNNGSASFTSTHVTTGGDPRGAAFGDFDGNGLLDVAVTNHDDRNISLVMNSGGGFAVGGSLSVGANFRPEGVVTGDLDGDLDDDIAAATNGNGLNQATVFINNGGSFAGPFHYATGGLDSSQIAIADLDCDDDLDLATINKDSNSMSLLPNNGNGTFAVAMTMATGGEPEAITAADLDGDDDADLAVANQLTNDITVVLNQCGTGTGGGGNPGGGPNPGPKPVFAFVPAHSVPAGTRPSGVASGDFDGDLDEDLVTTADDPDRLVFLTNDGAGGFTPGATVLLPASSS